MSVRERLDRYWFEPARVRDLAWLRIAIVFVLWADAMWPGALAEQLLLARLPAEWFAPLPALKIFMLPFGWGARPSAAMIVIAWIVCGAAGMFALVGAYTRVSLTIFAAATTFLLAHFYSYGTMEHMQAAATIVLWMLILTPSGDALSVDALRARVGESRLRERFVPRDAEALSRDARWPLRLVQWLLVIIYMSAALAKITMGKAAWMNGYTMTYYLLLDGSRHHVPLTIALAHVHWLGVVTAVVTLAFELTFVVCVLYPRAAPVYLATGVALHTGIAVLMQAPFYQLLALYVAFAEPVRVEVRRWLGARARGGDERRVWTLIYDGHCPLCIRTMTQLDALDERRVLQYVDLKRETERTRELMPGVSLENLREEMAVVTPERVALRGFFAFREISKRLPTMWLLVPLLFAPGAEWVGTRVYAWVAANRVRRLCEGDACVVHGVSGRGGARDVGVGATIDFEGSAS